MLENGKYASLAIFLALWFLSIASISIVALHKNRPIKILWGLVYTLSTIAALAYRQIGQHALTYEDVEILWISRANTLNVLQFYFHQILWPLLQGILGFSLFFLPGTVQFKKIITLLPFIPLILVTGIIYRAAGYGTQGLPTQYSSLSTILLLGLQNYLYPGMVEKRAAVTIPLAGKPQFKHIIYIVDESVRSDMLDLNGSTGITPFLLTQRGRLANFGRQAAGNNCSGYSNAILRMGAVKQRLDEIGRQPLIWSYALQAGLVTHYLDGQQSEQTLQNFMTLAERAEINHFTQYADRPEHLIDRALAFALRKILNREGRQFVYVNKRGAHFPYASTYPRVDPLFSPHMRPGDKYAQSKEKLINSYKNSIHWNVDEFFKTLLTDLDLSETIIIYTSDHGQHLMEKGKMATHCNTQSPYSAEGDVPFLLLTDNPDLLASYQYSALINKDKTTHFHIFPTLLNIFGFTREEIQKQYGPSLLVPIANRPQEFSAGPILPRFGRVVKWFPLP